MDRQNKGHPHRGTLSLRRNKIHSTCYNIHGHGLCHGKAKKPDTKGHRVYDSTVMKCAEKAKLQGQIRGCLGLGWKLGLSAKGLHGSY